MGHKVSGFRHLSQKSQHRKKGFVACGGRSHAPWRRSGTQSGWTAAGPEEALFLLRPHFYYLPLVYLHVCVRAHLPWCTVLCGSQRTTILPSYHVGPGDQTPAIRLGSACSGEPQSQLSGPENSFSNLPIPHLPPSHPRTWMMSLQVLRMSQEQVRALVIFP